MASDTKIKIVDDNLDNQEILSEMVPREGYEPFTFNSGVEFLKPRCCLKLGVSFSTIKYRG